MNVIVVQRWEGLQPGDVIGLFDSYAKAHASIRLSHSRLIDVSFERDGAFTYVKSRGERVRKYHVAHYHVNSSVTHL